MRKPHVRSVTPLVSRVYTEEEVHFNQWLAGFIDGDGHFRVQNTYCRFQVEQATWNLHLLELLKGKFGGKIDKCKRYQNTHLYALSDRETLIELAHRVNGNIRATTRNAQFQNMCEEFSIVYKSPCKLDFNNQYLAGLLDADGCITCNFKLNSLKIRLTSKYFTDIEMLTEMFKGNVLRRRTTNDIFEWEISAKTDVLFAQKYFEKGVRSNKLVRCKLIPSFYELREKKAYKLDSEFHNDWQKFESDWFDNGADIYRRNCTGIPFTAKARNARDEEGDT